MKSVQPDVPSNINSESYDVDTELPNRRISSSLGGVGIGDGNVTLTSTDQNLDCSADLGLEMTMMDAMFCAQQNEVHATEGPLQRLSRYGLETDNGFESLSVTLTMRASLCEILTI